MTVDDVVDAIYERLCLHQRHQRHQGVGADMSLTEWRLALGVTEAQLREAVTVLRISEDLMIAFTAQDRLTLGPSWRRRCNDDAMPLLGGY